MDQDVTAREGDLLFTLEDGIGRITFNRPQARNAFTFAMYERLAEICERANTDRSIKVLLLRGAGDKAFAAGTDINQFRAFKTPQDALDYENRIDRVLGILETCRVPTIAAINGACTGGGAGIAAVCDLRICTPSLKYGFPMARTLGNTLSMANFARLTMLIGAARLKEILFMARLIGADEAAAIGLVNEVVATEDALEPRVMEIASTVSKHAPLTMETAKEALRRIRVQMTPEDGGLDLVVKAYMSEDFKEGIEAFFAKRPAQWKGR